MTTLQSKKRTFGERCADLMRHGMGTWTFLIIFGSALVLWIVLKGFGTDPSPYFKLNLFLSMLAGLQGAVLLISAKRADRMAQELQEFDAEHSEKDYHVDVETNLMIKEILAILQGENK